MKTARKFASRFAVYLAIAVVGAGGIYPGPPDAVADELDDVLNKQEALMVRAKFRVEFPDAIDSRQVEEGDKVEADLMEDIENDDNVIAPKGSKLFGKIVQVDHSRSLRQSMFARKERFRRQGAIRIVFDEVLTAKGEHFAAKLTPVPQVALFNNGNACRKVRVGPHGEIVKAETVDLKQIPALELAVPIGVFERNRYDVKVEPGDEIIVSGLVSTMSTKVSGKLVSNKKKKPTKTSSDANAL